MDEWMKFGTNFFKRINEMNEWRMTLGICRYQLSFKKEMKWMEWIKWMKLMNEMNGMNERKNWYLQIPNFK
jgi:N-glycosylase/DNA lyase